MCVHLSPTLFVLSHSARPAEVTRADDLARTTGPHPHPLRRPLPHPGLAPGKAPGYPPRQLFLIRWLLSQTPPPRPFSSSFHMLLRGVVGGESGKEMSVSTPTILLSASTPISHLLMPCPRTPPGHDTMSPHPHPPFAPFTRRTFKFAALASPWCRGYDMTPPSPLRVAMGRDTMSPLPSASVAVAIASQLR